MFFGYDQENEVFHLLMHNDLMPEKLSTKFAACEII